MLILERRRVKLSKPNIIILGALILVFLISILNITSTHLGAAFAPIHEEEVTISFEPEIEKVVTVKKISKNDVNDSNNMSTAQNKNKETTNEINAANTKPGKQEQRTPPNASILAVKKTALENQEQSTPDHSKSAEEPAHRFAYAYLMAGCDANCCYPKNPGYLGYIYNIIVSKRILLERGSNIDVVVLVRMHTDTNETRLPPEHESMLVKSGVIIKYLPKPVIDNFHTAMMDKFSILNLIEYERVMFLDSDVMPIWNMDYMFELTTGDKPVLEENVILAYKGEPANGGCFILKPDRKDYCDMLELIDKHENLGYDFNKTIGWGHVITPPDAWVPYKGKNGTLWDWHGAFTDQGLLYYWTKYHKKKVSIIIKDKIQRWNANKNGESHMVSVQLSRRVIGRPKTKILAPSNHHKTDHPYADFEHFVTTNKPWLIGHTIPEDIENMDEAASTKILWFHILRKLNKEYDLGIDIKDMKLGRPVLGLFPTNEQVMMTKEAKEKLNGKDYNGKRSMCKFT